MRSKGESQGTSHTPPSTPSLSTCFLLGPKSLNSLNCALPLFQNHPFPFRLAPVRALLSLHSSAQASLLQEAFPDCCSAPSLSVSPHPALAFGLQSPNLRAERARETGQPQPSLSPQASNEKTEARASSSQGSGDGGQAIPMPSPGSVRDDTRQRRSHFTWVLSLPLEMWRLRPRLRRPLEKARLPGGSFVHLLKGAPGRGDLAFLQPLSGP